MEDLFRAIFDIGKDASLAALGGVVRDLQAIGQAGHELAIYRAEAEAHKRLALLARERGWQGILEEARLRQVPAALNENDQAVFEHEPPAPVAAYWAPLTFTCPSVLAPESSAEPWIRLANQLRSFEVEELLPSLPYRFRAIRYDGILQVEIVSEHGMAGLALGDLLQLVRKYRQERWTDKAGNDGETFYRLELRMLASQHLSEADLALTPDVTRGLFPDSLLDAMVRLARREVMVEHSTLPDWTGIKAHPHSS
jgi:hypothetical protein